MTSRDGGELMWQQADVDRLFEAHNQLTMELCALLGLDWPETKWGDIQDAVQAVLDEKTRLRGRLARIAEAHRKHVGHGGMTSGLCVECELLAPCPTYVWASADRDPALATWDPIDD